MGKPRLLPREQKLAVAALMVIVIWGAVSWAGLPLLDQLNQLQHRSTVSQRKLVRLRELVSKKPLIEQAYQRYASFRSVESDERIQGLFLDELEQMAGAGALQLNLKPRPIQREGSVSRLGVELDLDATQEALLDFLDRLLAAPSLIELERLRISPSASKEYPLRASLLVQRVVLRD